MMRAPFRVLAVLMTGALLGACDLAPDWFGGTEAPPAPRNDDRSIDTHHRPPAQAMEDPG